MDGDNVAEVFAVGKHSGAFHSVGRLVRLWESRRATEKNIKHGNHIGEKKFTKSENSFKPCHKPSKYKGLPRTRKAGPRANEPDKGPNNGP